jgi:two-component system CheB/CheR fusion protein
MRNLLNSTDIATVFLDEELRIKRFTEQAKRVIRLIPSDLGRPIGDLVSTLQYDRLVDDARDVLRTLVFKEREVRGQDDEFYLMRILPYRTTENVIEGLVLTFVDVTRIKALDEEQRRLMVALHRSPVGVLGELVGRKDDELFARHEVAPLIRAKQRVLETGSPARVRIDLPLDEQRKTFDFYLVPAVDASGAVVGLSCVAMDTTPPEMAAT